MIYTTIKVSSEIELKWSRSNYLENNPYGQRKYFLEQYVDWVE